MNIPITPEIGVLLIAFLFGGMLYTNREGIRSRDTASGKMLYIGVVLVEVTLIIGERFVVPPILGSAIGHDSTLYNLVDIGVFVAIMLGVFAVGRRVKERIR